MKIEKFVEFETEVEIHVDIDDIASAIIEDREKSRHAMLRGIINFHKFMEAMPDDIVSECNSEQAKIIAGFFEKQLVRFKSI
ncbi:hypothetical protein [Oceanobacter sp. 3_MG-2023]|uniref:hypothetical protein n=1 Tax=Oceanobacter sp. 3_MG-2023 TaxID=3062622 RepID=UPI00273440B8|nr:hypothetical protein [Oceanobacter sp. 3_MG-2023]MDP2505422.1 hypothetical protein [Oceanobacter sp. 3_MG-2023]